MHEIPSQGENGVYRGTEPCSGGIPKVLSRSACDKETLIIEEHGKQEYHRLAARIVARPSFLCLLLMLISLLQPTTAFSTPDYPLLSNALSRRASNVSTPLLECLQVAPPVLSPKTCQQTLMDYTFGYSYGIPFVAQYIPPDCEFNRVTINFTVSSAGRQFDRLGHAWFNDTEIFRTSTAEPTQTGIIWTYTKDMTNYLSLFKEPQKLIFDLGNLIDDTYTGSWNTTLTANFFTAADLDPADLILPVSSRKSASNQPSQFVIPDVKAVSALTLPQNAKKAVFSISACGQATEEFWWANVLSSDTTVFGNESTLYGYSGFREIQLYIDGIMAGVAWPFPVIFTGGVVPGFWRPVVGIDAFDLREDEIDITAFLPLLSDGEEHSFEIKVVGIDDDGHGVAKLSSTVGSNWPVSGKVFVWLDANGNVTSGTSPTIAAPEPALDISSSVNKNANNGSVKALDYSVKASRRFSLSSTVQTSEGSKQVTWSQELNFWLNGRLDNGGNNQNTSQSTTGKDASSASYHKSYDYPLWVNSSYNVLPDTNYTIDATMGRGKYIAQTGSLAFPSPAQTADTTIVPAAGDVAFTGVETSNWQNGTAHYLGAPVLKKSFGSGTTEQLYSLDGITDHGNNVDLYRRHIIAVNDSVTFDQEVFGGESVSMHVQDVFAPEIQGQQDKEFANAGIRNMLGRGPL